MIEAVSGRFEVTELVRGPYLSRYLGGKLDGTAGRRRVFAELQRIERERLADGSLPPTGFRLVAQLPGSGSGRS
jgi:hypothetical protein